MTPYGKYIAFLTLLRKDVVRNIRIWPQTFLPSVVTSVLYFTIFGTFLGSRIGDISGHSYVSFVVPGLVMLAVITNAYSNVATTFFTSKFFARNIDEILVSPTPPSILIAGYVAGGIFRGVTIGVLVLAVSLLFAPFTVMHPVSVIIFLVLTSLIFSLGGLVNGIYAKSFDAITIVPTFVLTPLVYLGGVFYSVSSLPHLVQVLSHFNPVFYLVNGFRYGLLGITDIPLGVSYAVLCGLIAVLIGINFYFLRTGLGLRT